MKVIFVSGAYHALSDRDHAKNIELARLAAAKLWSDDTVVICPHSNSAWFENYRKDLPVDVWTNGYLELLRRSDALYVLRNSELSKGARAELQLAKELGIPIHEEGKSAVGNC